MIGLGSNLGERSANIRKALTLLEGSGHFCLEKRSLLYESRPVGPTQPDFLNGVVEGKTDLSPETFLSLLKKTEKELGRSEGLRWGPRVVDLDLLSYGESIVDTPSLTVPHPRLEEREFVLVPLSEIAPSWRHPKLHKSALELLEALYSDAHHPASRPVETMEPLGQAARRDDRFRPDDGGAS